MNSFQSKATEKMDHSVSTENSKVERDDNLFEYEDNRSVAFAQRKLQDTADKSHGVNNLIDIQRKANNSGRVTQLKEIHNTTNNSHVSNDFSKNQEDTLQLESSSDGVNQMSDSSEEPPTEASTRPKANASGDLNFAKAKWAEISGMLEDVRTARQKTDMQLLLSEGGPINQEASQTKTKGGATLARKMFSIEKDRKWNELTEYLKANGINVPAGELVDKTNLEIYSLLARSGAKIAEFLSWYKELKDIVNKYQKAEKVEATKGKKYDKMSGGQSFLTEKEIKNHIDSFGDGLGAFISESAQGKINYFKTWGRNNNFVTTKNTIDSIIAKANGKKDPWWAIEESLGFPKGMFKEQCPNKTFYTYIIEKNMLEGQLYEILRLPQATDDSSFAEEWIAGGFTKGNNLEGVIKALSKEKQVDLGVSPFDQLVTVSGYTVSDDGSIRKI